MVNVDGIRDIAKQASAPGSPAPGTASAPDKDGYDASINPYEKFTRESNAAGYAIKAYRRVYGRDPSQEELAQVLPSYVGSDKNITDISGGDAYVAQLHQASENTPAKVYERQQAEWKGKASQFYDTVNQMVQGTFGRPATQDELDHYGTALASGQVDAYTVQGFLKAQPEYQNAQDETFRKGVDTQLQDSDQKFFGRAKEDIISRYAQMGRSTSPALDAALTELSSQLNERRGTYMAQLSAQQYGGNKAAAMGGYESDRQDWNERNNSNINTQLAYYQDFLKRGREIQDYNREQTDFGNSMDRYGPGRGAGPLDYINTGLNVANTAGKLYTAF